MIFYLFIIIMSSCQAFEPDYSGLMATEEYKKLEKATQDEKNEAFKVASDSYILGLPDSRKNTAIALLAGAKKLDRIFYDLAVLRDDIALVRLFFDKGFNGEKRLSLGCNTEEMASLLTLHGQEIYNREKNINAVSDAIVFGRKNNYIKYLLTKFPQASKCLSDDDTSLLWTCLRARCANLYGQDQEKNKDIFKLLINFGADPYEASLTGRQLNPLQLLQEIGSFCVISPNTDWASWMQQYYHVKKDLIPSVLKTRRRLLQSKGLSEELIDMILQMAFYGKKTVPALSYLKPEVWEWHGRVPKQYENYRNKNITLPEFQAEA